MAKIESNRIVIRPSFDESAGRSARKRASAQATISTTFNHARLVARDSVQSVAWDGYRRLAATAVDE